jgi:oxalate decarboxylase
MHETHLSPRSSLRNPARMTVFGDEGKARTFDYQAGDVGYVPMAMSHFIENTGSELLRFLELFRAPRFEDVSLAQRMALTPHELVAQHLNLDVAVLDVEFRGAGIVPRGPLLWTS